MYLVTETGKGKKKMQWQIANETMLFFFIFILLIFFSNKSSSENALFIYSTKKSVDFLPYA